MINILLKVISPGYFFSSAIDDESCWRWAGTLCIITAYNIDGIGRVLPESARYWLDFDMCWRDGAAH